MNTISKVTGVITRPARTVGTVAGATVGVGLRTTARVLGWAVERAAGPSPEQAASTRPPVVVPQAPAAEAPPADTTRGKSAPARKASARKAPSKKAAVMAPALGLTEAEVEAGHDSGPDTGPGTPDSEPLLDPATAKAVASEARTLQRAADPDKG